MALTPGSRIGVFQLVELIGRGGMGEVYRATDTSLGRQVAIKVLPQAFAQDAERLARFEREAKTLASLNHPNIAAIHAIEKSGGVTALVMELVEGDDLSQRIARGAIPVDEALPIAKQIAEALEAAHEQGIIHRDLKPANIKVRSDGTVKVLDFGLAKAMDPTGAMSPLNSMSPTITTPAMTQAGMILGTAAYMSPEQVKGRTVDRRADVWAFGAVLYEMLTGTRAFEGDGIADTLGNVMKVEPNWQRVPASIPPRVVQVMRACLQKHPKQRMDSAQDVRLALEGAFETVAPQTPADMPAESHRSATRSTRRRVVLAGVTAAIAGGALVGAATWYLARPTPPPVIRTEVTTAGTTGLSLSGATRDLAITPDGSRLVYRGQAQLLVRALDHLTPTALTGLGAPRGPFVSPDGQWVGYFDGPTLKKVPISGGPPVTLTGVDGSGDRGATWGADETVVYATLGSGTGLQRISAAGGEPSVLTRPNRGQLEEDHLWPEFLPGGRAVLFTITAVSGGLDAAQVAVLDLRTNTQTVLVRGGSHAHYVPSGHLVYAARGTLQAVAFDLNRLAVIGTPVPVLEQVVTTPDGGVAAAAASSGTLAYVSGVAATQRTLVWVDRDGREEPLKVPPRAYAYAQISPDGTRLALDIRDEQNDIWIWDLARETLQRLTFDPGFNRNPVWNPDGKRVAFSRAVGDGEEVYVQAADGSGMPEPLTKESKVAVAPNDFSPDGSTLLYSPTASPRDIVAVSVGGQPGEGKPLLASVADENQATVSPDGRWLAYASNESGRPEVYVRPFPTVTTGRWQISTGGGARPRWSRDGRELFYYVAEVGPGTAALMVVTIQSSPTFAAGTPTRLFQGNYLAPQAGRQVYDVSPDGRRFLMIKPSGADTAPPRLILMQHFDEELKRLVPTK